MSFPRYPAYKPSGVEWLGEVPEHWDVTQLKWQIFRNDGGVWGLDPDSESPDTIVLRSTEQTVDGNWQLDEPATRRLSPSEKASSILAKDDLLITKSSGSSAHIGKTTIVTDEIADLNCCYSNFMQRLRLGQGLRPTLAWYAMNNRLIREQFDFLSNSTTGLANLNGSMIGQVLIPLAPPIEQDAIATFLDHETTKIDALIAEQQRLIELLQEKRQAVISHAVSKGLNPHAPMKDSGVEWLGEVPEHWSTTALKRIVSVCGRIGFRGYTTEDLVPEGEGALVLGGANLTSEGRLDLSKQTFISWHKYEESPEIKVSINDLVIGQRGTCGKVVMIDHDIGPATINPSLVLLRRPTVDSEFLCYWLMGDLVQSIFESFLNATAVPMLSQQQIGNVRVIYPPLDEQRAIVSFVTAETAGLDTLTAEAKCAIALLQERRSALISAGVTGQIDVRGLVPEAEAA